MTERSCVACRKRRSTSDLVELHLHNDALHLALESPGGRGAWVCASKACISALSERRGLFNRAFRCTVTVPGDLANRIRNQEWSDVEHWITLCLRQGLCRTDIPEINSPAPPPRLWLMSTKCSPEVERTLLQAWPNAVQYKIDLNTIPINDRILHNLGTFLGFWPGRATQRLHIHLQRWADMG